MRCGQRKVPLPDEDAGPIFGKLMKRTSIVFLTAVALLVTASKRREGDNTYRWRENIDAVGRVLSLDSTRFLGAGFVVEPFDVMITASHVAATDTVLFERVHSRAFDTVTAIVRIPHKDLAVFGPLKKKEPAKFRLGSFEKAQAGDSAIYLGLEESGTIYRIDAPLTAKGLFQLPGQTVSVDALTIDCNVRHGMSGGPVMNMQGEVIGVLTGRLLQSPQGGDDSTAVLAVSTDTLATILRNWQSERDSANSPHER